MATESFQQRKMGWRDTLLEQIFLSLRKLKPTRERVTLGEKNDRVEREHVARYIFARQFCNGKRVADIACGTGYGMKILGEAAASVDGYDKKLLCGNIIMDLDKESWKKSYDVIVSFETIEHLAYPQFFLENIARTSRLALISSPIGEFRGYNPHHKQVWNLEEFKRLMGEYFDCAYYFQIAESIYQKPKLPVRFAIAVGTPRQLSHS
jgi:2-polyprenyl-3-methyl-5-hydroxy-6-metoxy-1,4-benzoquinol methylase